MTMSGKLNEKHPDAAKYKVEADAIWAAFNRECEKIEDNYGGIRKETARFILKDERPLIKKLSSDMDSLRKKYNHVFK